MTGQRVVVVVLLVASLFVLGTLSASLDATVTSTPDEVIDVDTDSLPFVGDGASEIADSYRQSDDGEQASGAAPTSDGNTNKADGESGDGDATSAGDESPPAAASGGSDEDRSGASDGVGQQQDGGSGEDDTGQGPGEAFTDSPWGLLAQYLVVILALLALFALVLIGRFFARRREQLLARLRALADHLGLLPADDGSGEVAVPDGEGEAATVVERAWGEMLHASGANPPPGDTPRECARRVVATGADPEPVEELTAMYERVRYGHGSITADDASRALAHARETTPGDGASIDGGPSAVERSQQEPVAPSPNDGEEARS